MKFDLYKTFRGLDRQTAPPPTTTGSDTDAEYEFLYLLHKYYTFTIISCNK